MKKKLCSILLALTMVLTLLPVSALAEDEAPAEAKPEYVAQIGEKQFATLQAAIDAVTTDTPTTIDVLADLTPDTLNAVTSVSPDRQMAFTKPNVNITLNLNNHTVTALGGEAIKINAANVTLTVTDGTIENHATGDYSDGLYAYKESNNLNLTLTNVKIHSRTQGLAVQGLTSNSNVTINGGEIISSEGLGIYYPPKSGTLTVNDAKIEGKTGIVVKGSNLIVKGNSEIIGVGDKIVPDHYYTGATDGSSSLTETGDAIYVESGYDDRDITVKIENGKLTSANSYAIQYYDYAKPVSAKREITISGGTFSDLSALDYLADGANVTVKLAADTTKDVTIPANTTVTLDLAGHKIVNSATAQDKEVAEASRKHTITNNGTLTILDSVGGGVVDNVSHGRAALYNAGTIVEIKGGKFTRSVDNSTDATSAKGNSWYVIYNAEGANITKISSGEFLALGHFSSLFCNSGTINEISGGTFTQDGFIAFKNQGTVNKISGGTFSSESESCIQNWGTIGEISDGTITAGRIGIWNFSSDTYKSAGTISRITGGNISGTTAAIRLNDYDTDYKDSDKNVTGPSTVNKANASISAGNFSGALEVNAHTVLTITGGTYTSDPSAYVVPGYVASYNGSTYTVYYPVPVIPNNNNNSSSTTTKNPDGSTTTTTTDKATGAVTETTTTANGSVGTVKTAANGSTEISASISAADVKAAEQKNAPVIAPITVTPAASSAAAPVIKLSVPANAGEVAVAIPVVNAKQGTVAVRVNPDGTEEIIKTAVITENGLVLGVKGSMQIKVINNSKNFADTVGHWAASDVDFVSARELFNGTAPALFSPEASMTRGMVVTVIARLAGENTDGGANWYDKGCAWAVANGVSDGTDPNGSITREQLAAMLYRYCGSPAASGSLSAYADAASVSAFASDAMQWCVNNGIINGMDGLLNPQGQATRAQVSAMFARYIRLEAAK